MTKRVFKIIIAAVASLMSLSAAAQIKDISFSAGVNVPMYKGVESDAVLSLNYGQFYWNGLGFRAGLQWSPSVSDVDNAFGVPVAFAYRTKARITKERIYSGAVGAADAMENNILYGNGYGTAGSLAGGFLMNLFSDMEYFVGITPGYIAGQSSSKHESAWGASYQYWENTWTEKKNAFSLTLDAGMALNYSIWRFDLKLTPAFHYNLINSLAYQSSRGEKGVGVTSTDTQPLRWFFTLSGGLAFRF